MNFHENVKGCTYGEVVLSSIEPPPSTPTSPAQQILHRPPESSAIITIVLSIEPHSQQTATVKEALLQI